MKQNIDDNSLFNFKLDLLKTEIGYLKDVIGKLDETSQQIKNWAILIWAGSISLIIGNSDISLRKLIVFVSVIPLLFWIVDGNCRRRQRQFIFRNKKISEYINSDELVRDFEQKQIKNLTLLDLMGTQYKAEDVEKFASVRKLMWFNSLRTFYLGLIILTVVLQLILYPNAIVIKNRQVKTYERRDSILISNQINIINDLNSLRTKIDSFKIKHSTGKR
jgi:hypothetical protein